MSDNMNTPGSGPEGRRRWTENFEVAADQLTSRVQELVSQGNVRRLIIKQEGRALLDIPLTVGVVGGVAGVFLAPMLAALVAIAGIVARVELVVEREGEPPSTNLGGGMGSGPGTGI
ncbi:MAG: DUF4342 domain-containing protein [Chloroflexota bacterium]